MKAVQAINIANNANDTKNSGVLSSLLTAISGTATSGLYSLETSRLPDFVVRYLQEQGYRIRQPAGSGNFLVIW